jgi:DnaJ domain
MSFSADPYQVLGLAAGASQGDVKRAYRVLAKRFHPDSAGETALPRFLAIQAAYETITGSKPGARPARPAPEAPRRPFAADDERARATRDAYRARRSSRAGQGPSQGTTDGTSAGATGRTGDPAGATGGRPAGPGSNGSANSGSRPSGGRERGGRRRTPKVATFGSTSYDDPEEREPAWDGAGWYGGSSGTYWTINPKEYADPRKHGPEYLARGRRRAPADPRSGGTAGGAIDDEARQVDGVPGAPSGRATWERPSMGPAGGGAGDRTGAPDGPAANTTSGSVRGRSRSAGVPPTAGPDPGSPTSRPPDGARRRADDARAANGRQSSSTAAHGSGASRRDGGAATHDVGAARPSASAGGESSSTGAAWIDPTFGAGRTGERGPAHANGPAHASGPAHADAPHTSHRAPRSARATDAAAAPGADGAPSDGRHVPPMDGTRVGASGSVGAAGVATMPLADSNVRDATDATGSRGRRPPLGDQPNDGGEEIAQEPSSPMLSPRTMVALLAWPPIGLAAAGLFGEVSGCTRYAATCADTSGLVPWAIQIPVLLVFLLLPAVARLAAVGSVAVLIAAVPAGLTFAVAGGNHAAGTASALLLSICVIAYAVGILGPLTGRIPIPRWFDSSS